jgi:hypothetical protein
MGAVEMSYDPGCFDLAGAFLDDIEGLSALDRARLQPELAQSIQGAIEDFIFDIHIAKAAEAEDPDHLREERDERRAEDRGHPEGNED